MRRGVAHRDGDDLEGDPDEVIKSCRLEWMNRRAAWTFHLGADPSGIVTPGRGNHPALMQASRAQDDVPEGCRNT